MRLAYAGSSVKVNVLICRPFTEEVRGLILDQFVCDLWWTK
jgi:hypothetical protein